MPALTTMIKPVSSACNMRCRYCFYADVARRRERACMGRMTDETLETLVRRAMRYAEGGVSFAFQGGEPTLAGEDFFRKLVEYEKRYNTRGLKVSNAVQSNGYDISDELMELFAVEDFLVGISLDGIEATHDALRIDAAGQGTYGRICATISRLEEKKVSFNILCVVNEYVARRPQEVFGSLSKYGYLQFIPCLDDLDGDRRDYSLTSESYTHFLKKTFDLYYDAYMRGRPVSVRNFDNYIGILLGQQPENCGMCGRCGQYYLIEADGSVYPCDFYVLDELRMGNINDASFFSLEKSPVGAEFRNASFHVDEKCRACKWYFLCRGGCRRDREPFVDGRPGLNKWCACFQALFEYAYPRMTEIAKRITARH